MLLGGVSERGWLLSLKTDQPHAEPEPSVLLLHPSTMATPLQPGERLLAILDVKLTPAVIWALDKLCTLCVSGGLTSNMLKVFQAVPQVEPALPVRNRGDLMNKSTQQEAMTKSFVEYTSVAFYNWLKAWEQNSQSSLPYDRTKATLVSTTFTTGI